MGPLSSSSQPPRAAVVFDCDGLLISTHGVWDRAYAEITARYRASITRADRLALAALPIGPLGHALAELMGHPAPPGQLGEELYALVRSNLGAGCTPMPGAVELVTALHGTRPLAVASGTPTEIVISYLEFSGIADAFDLILGGEHVTRPKPAPDIYQLACERLRANPAQCVAFEDSPTGAAAALTAGLYLIGIPSAPGRALPAHLHAAALSKPAVWAALGLELCTIAA